MAHNSARPVWKDLFEKRSVGVDFAVDSKIFFCLVGLGLSAEAADLIQMLMHFATTKVSN